MGSIRGKAVAAAMAVAVVAGSGVVFAPSAQAAKQITVWSDAAHAPVIQELTKKGIDGVPVVVVVKDPVTVGAEFVAAAPEAAPDVLWGDLAQTGLLADAGLLVPVAMTKKRTTQFRPNVLDAARVGVAYYGTPVQISNLALITNTSLVPTQPTTFAELAKKALSLEKAGKVKVPFAAPQGEGSIGVNLYPLFAGLGGYFYGPAKSGGLDPTDIGLMNKTFRGNAGQIDAWNATGLINSQLTRERAARVFAKGQSPFWLAGPDDLAALLKLGFVYRIGALPPVVAGKKSTPLLTVHGFMVTKYAAAHGVADEAVTLATKAMTKAGPQLKLAEASGWYPANMKAATTVQTGGGRVRAIGNAGVDGVAMPNVPQSTALWGPYGTAWSVSTSGATATPAVKAFAIAKKAVKRASRG